MSRLGRLTVPGSGVLGRQITWHSAFKGKSVAVYDIAQDAIERCRAAHDKYAAIYRSDAGGSGADITATRQRLTFTTDLAAAVAPASLVLVNSAGFGPEVALPLRLLSLPVLGHLPTRRTTRAGAGRNGWTRGRGRRGTRSAACARCR
jgi:hypothetical protein